MTPRYRVERVLGRGRHASLWLARDIERGDNVALKIAPRGSLREEFETLQAIGEGPFASARDCGVLPDGRPFLAMDFFSCGACPNARLPDAVIDRIVEGAAEALAAVHERGWVHRDIKPAHFLLRADDGIALCDFGSAVRAGTRGPGERLTVIGTPRYAAPEQIEGAAASPAADVYSLGVCLFEWLAGHPPFRGETLTELFSQHLRAPVPRLPREAARWQALVDSLLAKQPAQRPADGAAVCARVAQLVGEPS